MTLKSKLIPIGFDGSNFEGGLTNLAIEKNDNGKIIFEDDIHKNIMKI